MSILIKPLISEKTSAMQSKDNVYSFLVDKRASKITIKNEVEAIYKVQVVSVNTMIVPRKRRVRYTRKGFTAGHKASYKKAWVKLKENEVIDWYATS